MSNFTTTPNTPGVTETSKAPLGEAGENGGGMNAAIIGGVVAAVIVVLICLLVVVLRYRYRDKGTYHTNEAKGTEFAENADAALKNDPSLQEAIDETKKEYFI
ncbi:hypothetical protein XENTR_v10024859 [Xenopus tropicalis]|uniref:Glycophorin C (Gerbich blood group) n=1 Tax=Xenopus tropicalis TaxID=8364 RepID=A0A803J6G5_XENTR|nr:glycophorin-C [Xenopus tropicalis]KAE8581626.1 hypothetical protein XENTR_v10024859 [Xenopus tropicalis]